MVGLGILGQGAFPQQSSSHPLRSCRPSRLEGQRVIGVRREMNEMQTIESRQMGRGVRVGRG